MKRVNALQVRQSLGSVLDAMDAEGEPVLVEKDRRPRAVLVPLALFYERFVDRTVHAEREALEARIRALHEVPTRRTAPAVTLLRELRGPLR